MGTNGLFSCALLQKEDRRQAMTAWLWGAVIALALCFVVSADVQAGLINQETGEVYQPGLDDEGNLEEPPEWVPQFDSQAESVSFEAEVVVDEDFCHSALDLWLDNGEEAPVFETMGDAETRDALLAVIEGWIQTEIAAQQANLPANVSLGTASLTQMACPSSTYTYVDCLLDGGDWVICKRLYPMQPIAPHSALTLVVPASGPLAKQGTITLQGGLRYRETTRAVGGNLQRGCFLLDDITITGFTGVQNVVAAQVTSLFDANGELCLPLP